MRYLIFSSLTAYPEEGGPLGFALVLWTIIPYHSQVYMSTLFLQFSVFFFRLLIGGYSQLYRDRKHPLFRILMGLQAFFIAT